MDDSFPSLPPWNHPSSGCTRWQRRCIQSPGNCTSVHKCWTTMQQSSWASPAQHWALPVSAQSSFCWTCRALIWKQEGKARVKNFCGYQNEIQTKSIQTKRQLTLQSLSLTAPKTSCGLDSGSSEYFWLTTDFYTFLKPPVLALQSPGTKPADQLSPTTLHIRSLLSLPCRVKPHFVELRQRWNFLHLQAINPSYLPEPNIDGNSCVAVFP